MYTLIGIDCLFRETPFGQITKILHVHTNYIKRSLPGGRIFHRWTINTEPTAKATNVLVSQAELSSSAAAPKAQSNGQNDIWKLKLKI